MKHTVRWTSAASLLAFSLAAPTTAQQRSPELSGMWDPPATLEDTFRMFFARRRASIACGAACGRPPTAAGTGSARGSGELSAGHLREAAPQAGGGDTLGLDPADDQFLGEPWAFAREIFAPHQLGSNSTRISGDALASGPFGELSISTGGDRLPDSLPPMGYSVGHYEGDRSSSR
jgi:hypothetical protein